MEPEITLLSVFLIASLIFKISRKRYEWALSGRIAMSAMLVLTGVAHFVFAPGMTLMLPEAIPFRTGIIYITAILELLAAAGLQCSRFKRQIAYGLVLFFILLLPANIYAACRHINMETAAFDGDGPATLWCRVPLQFGFIAWVYFSVIHQSRNARAEKAGK